MSALEGIAELQGEGEQAMQCDIQQPHGDPR